jgi:DNA invertase Pin-like site-specific DNA recombinase
MQIGYSRISTQDQNLQLQIDALKEAGCKKIFSEIASGARADRQALEEALEFLRPGDVLVVWKLDRLGRSLRHLIETVTRLESKNIGFQSLQESISTTTSSGKLIFHLFACLAEFERGVIQDRTLAGLQAARSRGRIGGRPKAMDDGKLSLARSMRSDPSASVQDICHTLKVSRSTFYRYMKKLAAHSPPS